MKGATSPNSDSDSGDLPVNPRKKTLKKREKIKSRKLFSLLFENPKRIRQGCLIAIYSFELPTELLTGPCMVAFAVSKRHFKHAVKRNLLKRRMREIFRLNKADLSSLLAEKDKNLVFLLTYQKGVVHSYKEMEKDYLQILEKLKGHI